MQENYPAIQNAMNQDTSQLNQETQDYLGTLAEVDPANMVYNVLPKVNSTNALVQGVAQRSWLTKSEAGNRQTMIEMLFASIMLLFSLHKTIEQWDRLAAQTRFGNKKVSQWTSKTREKITKKFTVP